MLQIFSSLGKLGKNLWQLQNLMTFVQFPVRSSFINSGLAYTTALSNQELAHNYSPVPSALLSSKGLDSKDKALSISEVMQQLNSSDSLGALISFCPPKEKNEQQNTHGYGAEFQAMLDRINQEDLGYETGLILEKRQRLSLEQVKELERNFEVENRLEPERKVKLAEELGLQPRQVAIWFQNRRTRWKTKQLQRDYGVLKASYDALKLDCDNLQQEKEALNSKLTELKEQLCRKSAESNQSVEASDLHGNKKNKASFGVQENSNDGSSGRVSNGVVKEENESKTMFSICFNGSSSSSSNSMVDPFWFSESRAVADKTIYQPQPVRVEEQSLFPIEESCNFFSVDQAPTLHWYFPEQ